MQKELAQHIEDLEYGLRTTNRAEDRKLYETYLASTACLLSKVILNAPLEMLYKDIDAYERQCGNSWLIDPVQGKYPDSYRKFKELSGYPGYADRMSQAQERQEMKGKID